MKLFLSLKSLLGLTGTFIIILGLTSCATDDRAYNQTTNTPMGPSDSGAMGTGGTMNSTGNPMDSTTGNTTGSGASGTGTSGGRMGGSAAGTSGSGASSGSTGNSMGNTSTPGSTSTGNSY